MGKVVCRFCDVCDFGLVEVFKLRSVDSLNMLNQQLHLRDVQLGNLCIKGLRAKLFGVLKKL